MGLKKFLVPFVVVLVIGVTLTAVVDVAQAQGEQYLELVRQDLKTAKIGYMTEGMQLTTEQGDVFWPLYREYQAELAKVGDRRIANIKDYAEHFEAMTEDKAAEILKQSFKNRKDQMNLLEKYAKKVSKALDPVTAARFVQVENTLNLLIDLQLAGEIPLFEHASE
jgi:hypothetical protein